MQEKFTIKVILNKGGLGIDIPLFDTYQEALEYATNQNEILNFQVDKIYIKGE